mmetsp:Transcript_34592/g.81547  ORF Transcript_34592/g.81547 Transcript_34592/m.81547 type:complete len:205 (-) Transcript_34592:712-1326(-)
MFGSCQWRSGYHTFPRFCSRRWSSRKVPRTRSPTRQCGAIFCNHTVAGFCSGGWPAMEVARSARFTFIVIFVNTGFQRNNNWRVEVVIRIYRIFRTAILVSLKRRAHVSLKIIITDTSTGVIAVTPILIEVSQKVVLVVAIMICGSISMFAVARVLRRRNVFQSNGPTEFFGHSSINTTAIGYIVAGNGNTGRAIGGNRNVILV